MEKLQLGQSCHSHRWCTIESSNHPHTQQDGGWQWERGRERRRGLHILLLFRQISHCRIGRRRLTKHLKAGNKNMQHAAQFAFPRLPYSRRKCVEGGGGVVQVQVAGLLRHYFWAESEAALIADNVEPNVMQKSSLYFSLSSSTSLFPILFLSFFLLCFLFTCAPLWNPFPFPFWHICILLQISREIAAAAVSRAKCD